MSQTWSDLLFAHWPVPVAQIREIVPAALEIDVFDNQAWLGVVPFLISNLRILGIPATAGPFRELNVRTYVRYKGTAGVYFFSLDASSLMAVIGARLWYHLPYFHAAMKLHVNGDIRQYESDRTHRNAAAAKFKGFYRPVGSIFQSSPGSREYFLTERYCLFLEHNRRILRGDIHHGPWPLQQAEAEFELNAMAAPLGLVLSKSAPYLHFAGRLDTFQWPIATC